jgi:hypothetical protein
MIQRFCPLCATEVEDVGGFCRLGHRLRLDPPQASLGELRDEVDRELGEAEVPARTLVGAVAATHAGHRHATHPTRAAGPTHGPGAARGSGQRIRPTRPSGQPGRSAASPSANDPIASFAPPPRMDWGPERPWRTRLGRVARLWGR